MPPPLPSNRRAKKKVPLVAALLGFTIGPLSTIYFGWKVLLTTLLVVITTTLVVAWAMPFRFPRWYPWATSVFFGCWNYMLAVAYNAAVETSDSKAPLALINLVGMEGWYVRFFAISMGLYSGITLVKEERFLAALVATFLLTPLTICLFESIMSLLADLFITIFNPKE